MPTTNARGLPLYGDEAMPGWAAAYNAQSNALSTALDDSEQAAKDDDYVEFLADLPASGNWPGRVLFVLEDMQLYVHDGSGWILMIGSVEGSVVPVDGFEILDETWIRKRPDGVVEGLLSILRPAEPLPHSASFAIMEAGFRPTAWYEVPCTTSDGGSANATLGRVDGDGNVIVFNPGAGNRKFTMALNYKTT